MNHTHKLASVSLSADMSDSIIKANKSVDASLELLHRVLQKEPTHVILPKPSITKGLLVSEGASLITALLGESGVGAGILAGAYVAQTTWGAAARWSEKHNIHPYSPEKDEQWLRKYYPEEMDQVNNSGK